MNKIILLFLLSLSVLLQLNWERISVDKNVSVLLPQTSKKQIIEGKVAWHGDIDSVGKCLVVISDLAQMGMDAKSLAAALKKKETYTSLKNGILLGSDGKVTNEKITTFKGYPAYKIDFVVKEEGSSYTSRSLSFFIGSKMYMISVMSTTGTSHTAAYAKILESVIIK